MTATALNAVCYATLPRQIHMRSVNGLDAHQDMRFAVGGTRASSTSPAVGVVARLHVVHTYTLTDCLACVPG